MVGKAMISDFQPTLFTGQGSGITSKIRVACKIPLTKTFSYAGLET
jgi:hypothetical protein